ncbi:hypothetical protein IV63_GL000750 [Companilactobacillus crustorum]|uniref:Uncharacterized protein n=4 Tax=Companilactobacillus TaxID=2767879 RepID=A0A837RK24_9LACO|nr:hypothetical protein BI355_0677 [Companilactobacillus crustorum]KRK44320.1 hypothetical protein FD26_GL000677 [Companilactobacillus crustorum JCM 15951]KRO21661.1 hypothetical protein IV63_GL000750 [Companilactobacillus crustorum]
MEPIGKQANFTFQAWSGDKNKDYKNIDELMTDKFYSGKSLSELIDTVELDFI